MVHRRGLRGRRGPLVQHPLGRRQTYRVPAPRRRPRRRGRPRRAPTTARLAASPMSGRRWASRPPPGQRRTSPARCRARPASCGGSTDRACAAARPGDSRRDQRVHLLGLGREPRRVRTFEQVVERQQPPQHDLRRGGPAVPDVLDPEHAVHAPRRDAADPEPGTVPRLFDRVLAAAPDEAVRERRIGPADEGEVQGAEEQRRCACRQGPATRLRAGSGRASSGPPPGPQDGRSSAGIKVGAVLPSHARRRRRQPKSSIKLRHRSNRSDRA